MMLQRKIDDVLESVHLGDLLVDERDGAPARRTSCSHGLTRTAAARRGPSVSCGVARAASAAEKRRVVRAHAAHRPGRRRRLLAERRRDSRRFRSRSLGAPIRAARGRAPLGGARRARRSDSVRGGARARRELVEGSGTLRPTCATPRNNNSTRGSERWARRSTARSSPEPTSARLGKALLFAGRAVVSRPSADIERAGGSFPRISSRRTRR